MTSTLSNENVFYAFEPGLTPAVEIAQGIDITLETMDCFANQLHSPSDTLDALDWDRINPATGPVAFTGVKAGDIVRIQLKKVQPTGHATMAAIPGDGALGKFITQAETAILDNTDDGRVVYHSAAGDVSISAKPMVGVIGLATSEGKIPNGTPGVHGGNMDCTLIGEGATLYFRAGVDGGLFGCGDVHSVMGDGEVEVCGAETPALVTIAADVVNQPKLPVPFLENDELYAVIASAATTDEAYQLAIDLMHGFLTDVANLNTNDAAFLMSLVGNLKFCQVVDPEVTVRFEFPKWVLADLGFEKIGM